MRNSFVLILLWCFALTILYSSLSILRHVHFQSGGFDLGLYDQAVWMFAHFQGAYNTVKERIIFGDHLVLTLPLFSVLFYIWDDVRILLILQAGTIAFSALPIFLIAKRRLASKITALFVAITYSLFYGIQYGTFFDFHPIVIGTAILSWIAYFWETRKHLFFWIGIIIALLTQENMGIAITCLSVIFFFRREFRKQAVVVGVLGIIYSFLAAKIIAYFSPIGFQYWPQLPKGVIEVITQFFNSLEKRQVLRYSLTSFSFLPLFSPGAMLAVTLDLSQYFVTGQEFARMWSPFMHHRVMLAPFLVLGAIDGFVWLKKRKIRIECVAALLFFSILVQQYIFHFPLNKLTKAEYWRNEDWMNDTRQLLSFVPKEASVATQQNLVPHLSHRKEIYILWPRQHNVESMPCGKLLCWWLDFGGKPEYVVVDTRPHQWLTQILETNENWLAALSNMEKVGRLVLEKRVGTVKLYRVEYGKGVVY